MSTLKFDPGGLIPAGPEVEGRSLALRTIACARAACPVLHLDGVTGAVGERIDFQKVLPGDLLHFAFDTATGQLTAGDDRSGAYLESARGGWLPAWTDGHGDVLRARFARLREQHADEPPDARPPPPWTPGERVYHRELYPHDFTPMVRVGSEVWYIDDAACPDPACDCEDVTLALLQPPDKCVVVSGRLGSRRPEKADRQGRALWEAMHASAELVEQLELRRDEIRQAGPFVVGAVYERLRLAAQTRRAEAPQSDDASEDVDGSAVPIGLVRRLFDLGTRLYAKRSALYDGFPVWYRAEVRGPTSREAWIIVADDPWSLDFYEQQDKPEPMFSLGFPDRSAASWERRKQRIVHGWPLLGGTSLPQVDRIEANGTVHEAGADDLRFAIAIGEALLEALGSRAEEAASASFVAASEHRVELDSGLVEVRLTASKDDADMDASPEAGDETGDETDDETDETDDETDETGETGDETDDEEDPEVDVGPALEAFTDAALERGLATEVLRTAHTLVPALAGYAREYQPGVRWFASRCLEGFLEDYAPRKVVLDDEDITNAPRALRAVAEWLGAVGHVPRAEAKSHGARLERALVTFQKRARDPRYASPAKALFAEMRAAGVDPNDKAALDSFIAVKNAELHHAALAVPRIEEIAPTRWQPGVGEPAPAPGQPCGCGSGRRYKKCCMRR